MGENKRYAQPEANPNNLILINRQSPGDGVLLAFAAHSIHKAHPGKFIIDVQTPFDDLYAGMYETGVLTKMTRQQIQTARIIETQYKTIHRSNQAPHFYINGILETLEEELNLTIPPAEHTGFITLMKEETCWYSAPRELLGENYPFWVVNAGWKNDYTAKQWSTLEYQKLVDMFPEIYFVQVGAKEHNHPKLQGDNLLDFVGKTDLRQLIRLIWNSYGVITPCSMAMLLSYAVPPHHIYRKPSRACIAITGGREPNHWHQGPNMQYMHTCGMLDCCSFGGCWRSRVETLDDGQDHHNEKLCHHPVLMPDGQKIAKCMSMITADMVGNHIRNYMDNDPNLVIHEGKYMMKDTIAKKEEKELTESEDVVS